MAPSHLDRLLADQNGITNAQVVSCDIVNYSCRKSSLQRRLIDKFQRDIRSSLIEISKPHEAYARDNEMEFGSDIVTLATGDGIAVIFTFPGLHGLAMDFLWSCCAGYMPTIRLITVRISCGIAGATVIVRIL